MALLEAPLLVIAERDARWLHGVLLDLLAHGYFASAPGLAERARTIADECAAVDGHRAGATTVAGHHQHMTYSEAAQLTGVSARTIRRWAAQGRLPRIQIGGSVRVRRDDVERLVEVGNG